MWSPLSSIDISYRSSPTLEGPTKLKRDKLEWPAEGWRGGYLKETRINHLKFALCGKTLGDKALLLGELLLRSMVRRIRNWLGKGKTPIGRFLLGDVTLQTPEGVFRCRKETSDLSVVRPSFEAAARDYRLDEGVFVDVGAHIGKYTVMVARSFRSRGRVVAIEPNEENFRMLLENVSLNQLDNVTAVKVALWNRKQEISFYLPKKENPGLGSVVSDLGGGGITVLADTLDNVLEELGISKVDLIKIDAEGAELQILMGAKRILELRPRIVFESYDKDVVAAIVQLLERYDYQVRRTDLYWIHYASPR